jgi:GNAT superfamily N-acetyltransferase
VVVRTATGAELDRAGAVCVAAYRAHGVSSPEYERRLRDAGERALSAEVLVALTESAQVLGTVTYVARHGPYAQVRHNHEAELRMLAVTPDRQRAGVGALLVQASMQKAIADRLGGIVISTTAQMHAAHRLYQGLGFEPNPARDWSPRPGLRLHVYELDLTAQVSG